jgi:hypothetical protein
MELSRYYVANINYSAINNSLNSFVLCTCKRLLLLIIIAWVGGRGAMGRRVRGGGLLGCVERSIENRKNIFNKVGVSWHWQAVRLAPFLNGTYGSMVIVTLEKNTNGKRRNSVISELLGRGELPSEKHFVFKEWQVQ